MRSPPLVAAFGLALVVACSGPTAVSEGEDATTDAATAGTDARTDDGAGRTQTSDATAADASDGSSADTSGGAEETGPSPGCTVGLVCVDVPEGWSGPFVRDTPETPICDDGRAPAYWVGFAAQVQGECTCDCGAATATTCVHEVLGGGAPDDCADNDEVVDTCTFPLGGGPVTCASGSDCIAPAQRSSYDSYRTCTGGTGGVLAPAFAVHRALCESPLPSEPTADCEHGVCADQLGARCVAAPGDVECPGGLFIVRELGYLGFARDALPCACECRDATDCSFATWYDADACGMGGGDDDPQCSPDTGSLGVVPDASASAGCAPVVANPPVPDPVPVDPITICCTPPID